jgi:hypothetical protein
MIDAAYIQSNGKLFSGTYTDGWGGVRAIVDSGTIGGVQNNRRFVTVVVNANAQENEIRRLRLVFTCHGKGQLSLSTVNQDN